MRRSALTLLALVAAISTLGAMPVGVADEGEKAPSLAAGWDAGLLGPIAHVEKQWRKRGVQIDRIRVFPRHLLITVRADSAQDRSWALEALASDPALAARAAPDVEWISLCQPLAKNGTVQVDVLIDRRGFVAAKARKQGEDMDPQGALTYVRGRAEKAARPANMRIRSLEPSSREMHDQPHDAWNATTDPASAAQVLALLYNLAAWGDILISSAAWDRDTAKSASEGMTGPAVIECLRLKPR
jgi:hypothetical protein